MRLKWKLRLYYGALLVVLLSLLGIATSALVRREFERERQRREIDAAHVARRLLDERLAAIDSAVARVSRDPELQALAQLDLAGSRDETLASWLPIASRLAATYDLPLLKVLDAEGRVLSSAHWRAAYNITDSPGLVLALEAESSARLARDRDAEGEFLAIEAPRWLNRVRRHVVIGGVRADSAFVADLSERAGLPMQLDLGTAPLPSLDSLAASADSIAAYGADDRTTAAPPGWWQRARRAVRAFALDAPPSGSDWLSLPASPAELHGGVRLVFDRRGLFDLQRRLVQTFAIAALAGAILAWSLGWWISSRVTRPLEQLADGVAVLAEGGTPHPVRVEASAEVRDLVDGFNRMAENLADSRERLRRAERIAAWREVALRVAHEIKNSLAPIQISVDNVARSLHTGRGDLPALVDESAATVRGEVEALTRLVNAFNEMARLPDPEPAPHRLTETWERASAPFRETLALTARGLDAVPELLYDGDQIRRALHNLLLNAQEAGAGAVTCEARPAARGWELSVHDDGPGVAPEDRERLFEPYFTRKIDGTGLGLAIVYKICTDHGLVGASAVTSGHRRAALGSSRDRFRDWCPGPRPERRVSRVERSAAKRGLSLFGVPWSGEILIVDDEASLVRSLRSTLEMEGYGVLGAGTAQEGLERLGECDLVLLDVRLPDRNGVDVLAEIRQKSDVPVVMMSAHATIADAVKATQLGAHDFLEKPFTTERVLLVVRNALHVRRLETDRAELEARAGRRVAPLG